MTETEELEWQQRLRDGVEATLNAKDAKRREREAKATRRDYGLAKRHGQKLARLDAAALVDETGSRCRYLVSEEPPVPCPNERAPGGELCRPHLVRAAELARRLGLDIAETLTPQQNPETR